MTIGEVARRTGVSIKALRFYDELGILAVEGRSDANYRLFSDDVLECLAHIRALQAAGLTLRQVQAVARAQRERRDVRPLVRAAYADALARVDGEIADLRAKSERLRRLLANDDRSDDPEDLTLQCTGGCSVGGDSAAPAARRRRNTNDNRSRDHRRAHRI
ncbi:MAG TPA: MerR family transcriptional regulator [Candidatus Limnocylindria bacterium]|jgi:DNA-binding transcriptional MerR regulator|nr:MerR family transcriptional regulator [Candidatus Limnocylindria bacterium]